MMTIISFNPKTFLPLDYSSSLINSTFKCDTQVKNCERENFRLNDAVFFFIFIYILPSKLLKETVRKTHTLRRINKRQAVNCQRIVEVVEFYTQIIIILLLLRSCFVCAFDKFHVFRMKNSHSPLTFVTATRLKQT